MKKRIVKSSFMLFSSLIMLTFLTVSCLKPKSDALGTKCTRLLTELSAAATALTTNPTVANCEAYREALENYVDGCRLYGGYNDFYEDELSDWDCSGYSN